MIKVEGILREKEKLWGTMNGRKEMRVGDGKGRGGCNGWDEKGVEGRYRRRGEEERRRVVTARREGNYKGWVGKR